MTHEDLRRVARSSLSDGIVEQLISLISRGALKPGDRIPSEKQLCERFGVGRTSVREALRSLAVMGILTSHAGDGTYVSEDSSRYLEKTLQWGLLLDRKLVKDLIETRLMLECHAAGLAAERARPGDLQQMRESIAGMEAAVDAPERYLEHDLRFHLVVARATQNSILYNLLGMIRGYLQEWIKQALSTAPEPDSGSRADLSIREHKEILAALTAGDSERARRAMRAHIVSSSAPLRAGRTRATGASLWSLEGSES